jgi:predicted dehydrogenase
VSPAPRLGRRGFLGGSLAALASTRVPRLARPSDELRVAVVGLNGRGVDHVAALRALPGVRVAALCDVDDQVLARELRKEKDRKLRPDVHADLRHVLERTDIDAITIASPNHWHALQTIWACQAGKDVYVEKPATHVFAEGERVVAAARKHGRIVQCGMQSRTSPAIHAALAWLREGGLGAPELVRGLCYKPRPSIGKLGKNQRIPESVDYDLWCGPAPLLPLRRTRLHYDWHWSFATGDGDLGNQGVHQLDVARWVIGPENGGEELPPSVLSLGARLGYDDDGETPNTQLVFYAYEPVPLLFEVRGLPHDTAAQGGDWLAGMDDFLGVKIGVVVHCAGGTLRIPSYSGAVAHDTEGKEIRRWEEGGDAFANWIEAVRSRKVEDLAADIETGVRSSRLVQLGNASQRLAQARTPEKLQAELGSSETLRSAAERVLTHLDANGVDLAKTAPALGPCLVLDRAQGCIRENAAANALLEGSFREPYVLPVV